jgi:hypothetical protein
VTKPEDWNYDKYEIRTMRDDWQFLQFIFDVMPDESLNGLMTTWKAGVTPEQMRQITQSMAKDNDDE